MSRIRRWSIDNDALVLHTYTHHKFFNSYGDFDQYSILSIVTAILIKTIFQYIVNSYGDFDQYSITIVTGMRINISDYPYLDLILHRGIEKKKPPQRNSHHRSSASLLQCSARNSWTLCSGPTMQFLISQYMYIRNPHGHYRGEVRI